MIIKEKESEAKGRFGAAGDKQEKDVAFFLRREFGTSDQVMVLHDLRLEFDGEVAQLDHLIVHTYGFIIIESKSIYGEVKVNKQGEWSRSFNDKWSGMASPIMQAKAQEKILRLVLSSIAEETLGVLFGVQALQKQFGGRKYNSLCAVSSSAIIHRDEMPDEVSECVVKTEFLPEKLHGLMNLKRGLFSKLSDAAPHFTKEELLKVAGKLANLHNPAGTKKVAPEQTKVEPIPIPSPAPVAAKQETQTQCDAEIACKKCGEKEKLKGMYGKYGYYIVCLLCEANTPLKSNCPACGSQKTKTKKAGMTYTCECECGKSTPIFVDLSDQKNN